MGKVLCATLRSGQSCRHRQSDGTIGVDSGFAHITQNLPPMAPGQPHVVYAACRVEDTEDAPEGLSHDASVASQFGCIERDDLDAMHVDVDCMRRVFAVVFHSP